MNILEGCSSKKAIRAYVSVDRFSCLSERLYIALQGLPIKKHSQRNRLDPPTTFDRSSRDRLG